MSSRFAALVALLTAVALALPAAAGVAALATSELKPRPAAVRASPVAVESAPPERGEVLAATSPPSNEVVGAASNYPGTDGWIGEATVAMPGDLGGRYTGQVNGHVTVCADRCVRLPSVDWCECYRGTDDARVADLSHAAWALVTDASLEQGLVEVRLTLER